MSLLKVLWHDQRGFVYSMDVILVSTILALGTIVGLVCLRDQVLQELSDVANAVGSLNQSYSYSSRTITAGSFSAIGGRSKLYQPAARRRPVEDDSHNGWAVVSVAVKAGEKHEIVAPLLAG